MVTQEEILEFAQKGKWDLDYPEHTLPKKRYDLIIDQILVVMLLILIFYFCLKQP